MFLLISSQCFLTGSQVVTDDAELCTSNSSLCYSNASICQLQKKLFVLRLSDILVGCHTSTYDLFLSGNVEHFPDGCFPKTICRTFWCLFSASCWSIGKSHVCVCGHDLWLKAEISADMKKKWRGKRLRRGEVKEEEEGKGGWQGRERSGEQLSGHIRLTLMGETNSSGQARSQQAHHN